MSEQEKPPCPFDDDTQDNSGEIAKLGRKADELMRRITMSKQDTGGPAFACAAADGQHHHVEDGMTLLDYFAGQYIASGQFDLMRYGESEIAAWSYDFAEAMIAEKRRREGSE
jgi:hypothetical protein